MFILPWAFAANASAKNPELIGSIQIHLQTKLSLWNLLHPNPNTHRQIYSMPDCQFLYQLARGTHHLSAAGSIWESRWLENLSSPLEILCHSEMVHDCKAQVTISICIWGGLYRSGHDKCLKNGSAAGKWSGIILELLSTTYVFVMPECLDLLPYKTYMYDWEWNWPMKNKSFECGV